MADRPEYPLNPIWDDGEFVLSRSLRPDEGSSVLVLTPAAARPSPATIARLEHAFSLRGELESAWAARPLDLVRERGRVALLVEDPGAEVLARNLRSHWAITEFLQVAIGMASALCRLHERGLVHKDIKPSNILMNASGHVWLSGFGIASHLTRERQAPEPPGVIAGTLAYMAPEQTGRMNRSIDSRSDLYAAGITFFEMLTGTLPFTASEPMEWIHCHVARHPIPPGELVSGIPAPVSAIVLKLLSKNAEDRYQTAAGLESDLRRCLAEWLSRGKIELSSLGTHDIPDRLLIPEKLYGREHEIDTLLSAFERVVADGKPELVLVSGYSGVGKSSLVKELHKALVAPRGLFASGKFDQNRRDIPYASLAQAFRSLIRPILGMSEAEIARWQDAIRQAVGPNGQLIVNLIPELELVIGKQPPVPDLPPRDTQNRFQMVFRRFISVFANREHPLALFLDDLQWLDEATLELVRHLMTEPDIQYLLLIGAYRDNEVGPTHPLMRTLEAIRGADARVDRIVLSPLAISDVSRLIEEALHCPKDAARPLARLVFEKTGGNPFFAIQFLTALADEGLVTFEIGSAAWKWDLERIQASGYTDNVADLMIGKLNRLPSTAIDALKVLACLGNRAGTATLSLALGPMEQDIHGALWEAVLAGLVLRLENGYAFPHDRVQEAAYALVPKSERPGMHLRIGRLLRAGIAEDATAGYTFNVLNQLNRAVEIMDSAEERASLLRLNYLAGMKARDAIAYDSARKYLAQGLALLPEDGWTQHYEETFDLYLAASECEYLGGNFARADDLFDVILSHANSNLDCAKAYSLRMKLYQVAGRYDDGVAVALDALRLFGVSLPETEREIQAGTEAEFREISVSLAGRAIGDLLDGPVATDPTVRAIINLLVDATPCAYIGRPPLFPLITLKAVNYSMKYGNTEQSSFAYGVYSVMLVSMVEDISSAFQFSEMALRLNEKFNYPRLRGTLLHLHGDHVNFWRRHFATGMPILAEAFGACLEVGDLVYAGFLAFETVWQAIEKGSALEEVLEFSAGYAAFARQSHNDAIYETIRLEQQFVGSLQGKTAGPLSLDDGVFDEAASFNEVVKATFGCGIVFYHIMKQMLAVYYGRPAEALEFAARAEPLLGAAMAMPIEATYHLFHALTLTALYPQVSETRQQEYGRILEGKLKKLKLWAENSPENYANRYSLLMAEVARIEGREFEAARHYEDAIRSAGDHGFIQNQALAFELAAGFYAARGFERFANEYLRNARYCYLRWGAHGKVWQLDEQHPHLRENPIAQHPTATMSEPVERVDLSTMVRISQTVSAEIILEKLIDTLMVIALEHAGADRGLLILPYGDELRIEAEAITVQDRVEVRMRQTRVCGEELPESVLHYAMRTQQSVMLDDSLAPNQFSADEYVAGGRVRSMLCLPLIRQGTVAGVLYLENSAASHTFTPARIAVLKVLGTQAAISLENARLYTALLESESRLRTAIDTIPSFAWVFLADGSAEILNQRWLAYTGQPEADALGWGWRAVIHPDDVIGLEAYWRATLAGGAAGEHEARMRRFDGEYRWFLFRWMPLRDKSGNIVKWYGTNTDIEDRKRGEEALSASERNLRLMVESIPGLVWCATPDGTIDYVNQRILDYVGGDLSDLAELGWSDYLHPDDTEATLRAWSAAVQSGRPYSAELRIRRFDGVYRWFQASGEPLRDVDGEVARWYCLLFDIDDRKNAEEALRRTQAGLTRATQLATVGELAASIAHEVNQPLAAVVANGEACLKWLNRETPHLANARKAAERIVRDGNDAAEVMRRIRALFKRAALTKVAVYVNDVIAEVLRLLQSETMRRRIAVITDLDEELPAVVGDRVQVQQLVLNLVLNGMEAMDAVVDRPRRLYIRTKRQNSETVLVEIQDQGVGLEDPEKIFEAFFTTKEKGLGMGLSICRSIVEAHQGRLWTAQGEGPGATFCFTLPAERAGSASDGLSASSG